MPETISKKGWTKVAFGDVVRQVKNKVDPEQSGLERYVAGEHMDTDDLKIRRWGTIGGDYLGPAFHMRFRPGHVLYGSRRTYLRKAAVADFEGITANTTFVLETKDPNALLQDLLPFIMQTESFPQHSIKESKGSVNPYVNFSDLVWYEFALPPLEEQRRIVEVLFACRQLAEALYVAEAQARAVLDSQLNRHFPPGLDFPGDWVKLGDLCNAIADGTHQPPTFTDSGIPFLLVSNIKDGQIDWNTEKHVSQATFDELTKSLRPETNDVLYTLVGSYGTPAVVDVDWPFTFQRHIGLIRTDPRKLAPQFLYWYLRSPSGRLQAHWRATGLAQKTITLGELRSFVVPAPPFGIQDMLVGRFKAMQDAADCLAGRSHFVKQLSRAVLVESLEMESA